MPIIDDPGDVLLNADSQGDGNGRIVFSTGGVERASIDAHGAGTGLFSLSTTASISELTAGILYTGTITAALSIPVFVAPFACSIVAASVETWDYDATTSDTDYWTVVLRRTRSSSVSADVASKTTKATGGEAITHRSDWNFDNVTFDATNKQFQKGDCATIAFLKTGTASQLGATVLLQVRYEPV